MKFRPCIDLHRGKVVQIVGGSLKDAAGDNNLDSLQTNYTSEQSAAVFAQLYKDDALKGGHIISLGAGNQQAALEALALYPGGLQYGGGITPENAREFLEAGASHVIVTSYIFSAGKIDFEKLNQLVGSIGKDKLVLDLSCRLREEDFWIVTDRWQRFTEEKVNSELLDKLSNYCSEFLVHGVDVEGKRQGIQKNLIELLGQHSSLPVTYAGGVKSFSDLDLVKNIGQGNVDLTIGSALDIFGGDVSYRKVVEWTRQH